jgi:membrane protein implicated in regulation of membrane protease activity
MAIVSQTIIAAMILIGAGLMVAEAIVPGANFIVVGVGLLVTGLVALALPFGSPIILPFILIGVSGVTFRFYKNLAFSNGNTPQTTDAQSLKYSKGIVTEKVTPTEGSVRITDDIALMNDKFQARCERGEISEGTRIVVSDPGGGSILKVRPEDEDEFDKMLDLETETN